MANRIAVHEPLTIGTIRNSCNVAKQYLLNATLDHPSYADPSFRVQEIDAAILQLRGLRNRLECDAAIQHMVKG